MMNKRGITEAMKATKQAQESCHHETYVEYTGIGYVKRCKKCGYSLSIADPEQRS